MNGGEHMKTMIRRLSVYKEAADIFEKYRDQEMAVFLDSALENNLGQFSVIGLFPYLILKEENGICYKNGIPLKLSFEDEMNRQLK